jgi:hypothetical protein
MFSEVEFIKTLISGEIRKFASGFEIFLVKNLTKTEYVHKQSIDRQPIQWNSNPVKWTDSFPLQFEKVI